MTWLAPKCHAQFGPSGSNGARTCLTRILEHIFSFSTHPRHLWISFKTTSNHAVTVSSVLCSHLKLDRVKILFSSYRIFVFRARAHTLNLLLSHCVSFHLATLISHFFCLESEQLCRGCCSTTGFFFFPPMRVSTPPGGATSVWARSRWALRASGPLSTWPSAGPCGECFRTWSLLWEARKAMSGISGPDTRHVVMLAHSSLALWQPCLFTGSREDKKCHQLNIPIGRKWKVIRVTSHKSWKFCRALKVKIILGPGPTR